jgi:NAD-dependent SIR2 family protein deacetylase
MTAGINVRIPESTRWPEVTPPAGDAADLARFLEDRPRTLVITGAGCSTGAGIPAYRDERGQWTRRQPIRYQSFMAAESTRQRYWARSYLGWPRMRQATPAPAHHGLAALQAAGIGSGLVTQNVDGLHQRAGSRAVTELHGTLSRVVCQQCRYILPRQRFQDTLGELNPEWNARVHGINPDGDAELVEADHARFRISDCPECAGILKPDVVFFGENVPAERVESVRESLAASEAVLVVGSSLMVWSGYRFVREAVRSGKPVVAINQGRTRADDLLRFKVSAPCDRVFEELQVIMGLGSSRTPDGIPPVR